MDNTKQTDVGSVRQMINERGERWGRGWEKRLLMVEERKEIIMVMTLL